MPETSLFMKLVGEPMSKLLRNRIKRSEKVAELANSFAKNDLQKSAVLQQNASNWLMIGFQLTVLLPMYLYKKDDIPNAMNVVREENANEWKEHHKKEEMEREKQLKVIQAELLQNRIKTTEDLKEIIVNEVPGIVKKGLREESKDLKEIIVNEVSDIMKKVLREEGKNEGKEH